MQSRLHPTSTPPSAEPPARSHSHPHPYPYTTHHTPHTTHHTPRNMHVYARVTDARKRATVGAATISCNGMCPFRSFSDPDDHSDLCARARRRGEGRGGKEDEGGDGVSAAHTFQVKNSASSSSLLQPASPLPLAPPTPQNILPVLAASPTPPSTDAPCGASGSRSSQAISNSATVSPVSCVVMVV